MEVQRRSSIGDGVLQKSIKADKHVIDIPLTNQKVYIIEVGGKTVKLGI